MNTDKLPQIIFLTLSLIIGFGLFMIISSSNNEKKVIMICKKWVYSQETIWDKRNEINKYQNSSNSFEQITGLFGNQLLNFYSTATFEFKNNGNYIVGNTKEGLSVFLTQIGSWEINYGFSKISVTINNQTTVYEVEELTENSLKLVHKEGNEEIIEKFIPLTENQSNTIDTNISNKTHNENTDSNIFSINLEGFFYDKDILFGELIKRNATDKDYLFIRNDEDSTSLIKINGELINLTLRKEGKISNTLFFEDYVGKDYNVRIEYKLNNESGKYINKLEATIIVSINGKREVFEGFYAESRYD